MSRSDEEKAEQSVQNVTENEDGEGSSAMGPLLWLVGALVLIIGAAALTGR
jgi:hypothetical protein